MAGPPGVRRIDTTMSQFAATTRQASIDEAWTEVGMTSSAAISLNGTRSIGIAAGAAIGLIWFLAGGFVFAEGWAKTASFVMAAATVYVSIELLVPILTFDERRVLALVEGAYTGLGCWLYSSLAEVPPFDPALSHGQRLAAVVIVLIPAMGTLVVTGRRLHFTLADIRRLSARCA